MTPSPEINLKPDTEYLSYHLKLSTFTYLLQLIESLLSALDKLNYM